MKKLLIAFLFAVLLASSAQASDVEGLMAEKLGVGTLEQAAEDAALPQAERGIRGFRVRDALGELLRRDLKPALLKDALSIGAAVLLISAACGMVKAAVPSGDGPLDTVSLCGAAAMTLVVTGSQSCLLELGSETVVRLRDVSSALLPVLAGAAAASGSVTASAAKYAASALFLNILISLIEQLVLPLIRLYLAASVAEAACGGVLGSALSFLKWLLTSVLTVLMLSFTIYISVCSLTSGAADAAMVRSAKTLVSSALPVVGSIAADAAGAILSSAGVIRKSVGVYGLAAVAAVVLSPFLQIGAQYFVFRASAGIAGGFGDERLSKLICRFAEAMGMLVGSLGACSLLLYFSIYSLIGVTAI